MADFTPEQRKRFDEGVAELLTRYPAEYKGAALMEVLHLVQEILRWVPVDVMPLIAERLEIPVVRVREVTAFYSMYRQQPPGRHHVEVCTNVSCSVRGGDEVLERICERFQVKPGQTSADGAVTVDVVECLGSCGTAPMLADNREYKEELTVSKLEAMMDAWQAEATKEGA